jgi:hypothetical protein
LWPCLIALRACAERVPPLMGLTTDSESAEGVPGDAEVLDRGLGLVLEVPSSMPTLIRASWSGSASGTVLYDDGETRQAESAEHSLNPPAVTASGPDGDSAGHAQTGCGLAVVDAGQGHPQGSLGQRLSQGQALVVGARSEAGRKGPVRVSVGRARI